MEMENRILDKLDRLSDDIYEVKMQLSNLPSEFVTKREMAEAKNAAIQAKRWAVGTLLLVLGLATQLYATIF